MNVSGHRIGTAEIENVLVSLSMVAENACIGVPDEIKGDNIFVFVSLKEEIDHEKAR